jgi:hypothetical protein
LLSFSLSCLLFFIFALLPSFFFSFVTDYPLGNLSQQSIYLSL